MGVTKSTLFSPEVNQMADYARVLGHPARLAIIEHLIKQDACICNDLSEKLGLAQSTTSQHLAELKRVGLIQGSIEGSKMCYCINVHTWTEVAQMFAELFRKDPMANCC